MFYFGCSFSNIEFRNIKVIENKGQTIWYNFLLVSQCEEAIITNITVNNLEFVNTQFLAEENQFLKAYRSNVKITNLTAIQPVKSYDFYNKLEISSSILNLIGSNLTLDSSYFLNCYSTYGGAILFDQTPWNQRFKELFATISNSTFKNNFA